MQALADTVLASPISPDRLLDDFGLPGLAAILFVQCGLLIGFFLPGDTLLLAAGIALSLHTIHAPLAAYLIVAPVAAFVGNLLGYWIGYRAGPVIFHRPDSKLFRPDFVARSERFFTRWGWATVLVSRFVPVVRTVVPTLAGVGRMRLRDYVITSALGSIVWTDGMLLLGFWLGHIQFVREHVGWIDWLTLIVVLASLVPVSLHYVQGRRRLAARRRSPESSRDPA